MQYLIAGCILVWGLIVLCALVFILKVVFGKDQHGDNFNLTKEDFDFLIELQHEMLTQDHVSQAAPRFWVVAGTRREYRGSEYGCDGEVLIHDTEEVADGLEEAVEYFLENYADEMEQENITITSGTLANSYKVLKIDPTVNKEDEEYIEGEEIYFEADLIQTIDELLEAMIDVDIIDNNGLYDSASYTNEHYRYPDTMFLTNRSCKRHIELNHYHYSADAHSYAMTAWRSPEVEHLWKILDVIDWKTMRRMAYGYESDAEGTSGKTDATEHTESSGSNEQG